MDRKINHPQTTLPIQCPTFAWAKGFAFALYPTGSMRSFRPLRRAGPQNVREFWSIYYQCLHKYEACVVGGRCLLESNGEEAAEHICIFANLHTQ